MAFTKVVGAGIHTLSNITSHNINSSGIITATKFVGPFDGTNGDFSGNVSIGGSLTVNGDFTTLNTTLREVELLQVDANSTVTAGIITQRGTGDVLRLYDNNAQIFTVADGGNVTLQSTYPVLNIRGTNASSTSTGTLNFNLRDGNSANRTVAKVIGRSDGNGGYGSLDFHTAFNNTNYQRMSINKDGKVGMGLTSTSGGICDPDGNALLIRAASTIGTKNGHLMLTGDSATIGQGPQIVFSESGSGSNWAGAYIGHVRQGGGSAGDLIFATRRVTGDANTVPVEAVRIDSNGRVGIGTVTPTGMLDIKTDSGTYDHLRLRRTASGAGDSDWSLKPYAGHLFFRTGGANDKVGFSSAGQIIAGAGSIEAGTNTKLCVVGTGSPGVHPSSIAASTLATFRMTGGLGHAAGISILSGNTGSVAINLGDRDNELIGRILYNHTTDNLEDYMAFYVQGGEKLKIESGGGLKFTGQGTSIPVGGILHHTNNNLYVRGGTNGLILGNQNNTTTIQIYNGYIKFETNDGTEKVRITSDGAVQIGNLQTGQSSTTHTSATKLHIDSTKSIKIARLAAGNITSAGWFTVAKVAASNGNYFKCYASIGGDMTQDMCVMELTGSFSASGALQNTYAEPVFKAYRTGAHSTDRITRARLVKDSSNLLYLQIYIAGGVNNNTWGKSVLEYQIGAYSQNTADSGSAAMFSAQASGLTGLRTLEVDDNAICVNAGSHKFYTNNSERITLTSDGQLAVNHLAHHTSVSGIFAPTATTSGRFSYKAIEIGTAIASGTDQGAIIVGRRKAASSSPSALLAHWDDGTHVTLYHGGGWSSHASSVSTQHFYTDTYATGNNSGAIRFSIGNKGQIFLNNRDSNNSDHRGNIIAYAPIAGEFAYKSIEIGATNPVANDSGGLIVAQRKGSTAQPFALMGSWDNGNVCNIYYGGGWGSQSANATHHKFYTGAYESSGGSSGNERFRMISNGKIITNEATVDPVNDFEVRRANSGGDVAIRIGNNSGENVNTTASLYFTTSPSQDFNTSYIQAVRQGGKLNFGYSTNSPTLTMHVSQARVGIGTTTPHQKLDVTSGNLFVNHGKLWIRGQNNAPLYQTFTGYKQFSGSNAYVELFHSGHSYSIEIDYIVTEGGAWHLGGTSGKIRFMGHYGYTNYGSEHDKYRQAANGGRINGDVAFQYVNTGGSVSYLIQAKVPYTGNTHNFDIRYAVRGLSSANMYPL